MATEAQVKAVLAFTKMKAQKAILLCPRCNEVVGSDTFAEHGVLFHESCRTPVLRYVMSMSTEL